MIMRRSSFRESEPQVTLSMSALTSLMNGQLPGKGRNRQRGRGSTRSGRGRQGGLRIPQRTERNRAGKIVCRFWRYGDCYSPNCRFAHQN